MKKVNVITVGSLLLLLAGIVFYVFWGLRYNVWIDIGIYSVTIILILSGLFGILLSISEKTKNEG